MVQINVVYQGELRCAATHVPSGTVLKTDAPKDNHGKGESFSPTDLVATALGTCMLTTMAIVANVLQVDLKDSTITVVKEMAAKPSRRIGKLSVVINIAVKVDDAMKEKIKHGAEACPVHKSLHPDVQMPIEFNWAN